MPTYIVNLPDDLDKKLKAYAVRIRKPKPEDATVGATRQAGDLAVLSCKGIGVQERIREV